LNGAIVTEPEPSTYRSRWVARFRLVLVALAVISLVATGIVGTSLPANASDLTGSVTASTVLAQLTVATPNPTGYDRSLFVHWIDADGNGCDTRQEVLIQESQIPVVKGSGCTILSGRWYSWYDGATWTNPSDVDIDHMVPLSEAWQSGANAWTPDQRRAYANDLGLSVGLEAVTDNVNQSKGDKDPAAWMPPLAAVACRYATDWVLVKYRWNLTVDTVEKSALNTILTGSCGAAMVTAPAQAGTAKSVGGFDRISGPDRYSTAVAISGQYQTGVPVVYVATGTNYPDALSAAPAAAVQNGPLLLTTPTSLPGNVRDEIMRLTPALIVVVGGEAAISPAVYAELTTLAPNIRRDSGTDRYATSRIINQRAFPTGAPSAFIATANNFPDALSASAAAGASRSPVILVNGTATSLDAGTTTLLTTLGVTTVTIAGGTAVVSPQIETALRATLAVTRLAGGDRYTTSSAINRASFATAPTVYFAVGTGFADALAGAALAGRDNAALYVVPGTCVYDYVATDLQTLGTTKRVLLGGTQALSDNVGQLGICPPPVSDPPPAPPAPTPTVPTNPGDTKNCTDFSTWREAQNWFNTYYPYYGDVAKLDGNNNMIACESLTGHP
jgi:putative cell wall-binding protein